ncbi:DUF2213 domain-containing protein [Mesorhizobium sp. BR1-1-16]|uniref:DUF2213 domain-containing protein n=1 Tax=Mesorhizobium sp. BR1-1-16 TaxID=2876653 RepID=UPI001CC9C609|nr:DUF2213 domain-containing protein [Mesorhizobium sp. BR1-1-16]MBZ9939146.1 DUF2213 domain-containing protein [Mesorhizobium sp. BR1-1-16]
MVLVDQQIGRTRYRTPEGFLFCDGVRIARTGPMLYRADEVPDIRPAGAAVVIERSADVLFSADTIASFNGKPVTNGHPPDLLTPATWQRHAVGSVMNTRRGEGVEDNYLIADLLITDEGAIDDVLAGKCEVSCGHNSPREEVKPGLGRSISMTGNHVALVDRGRAGPACAIQDHEPVEEPEMAVVKRSAWDRLRTAFKAKDEAAFEEELAAAQGEPDGEDPTRVVIEIKSAEPAEPVAVGDEDEVKPSFAESLDERLTKIEASIAALVAALPKAETSVEDEDPAKVEEKKEDAPAMDAAAEADIRAKAEILSPGIALPTLDAKAAPKARGEAMHGLRVRSLSAALADPKRKAIVESVFSGSVPKLSGMTFDSIAVVFNAASAVAAGANKQPVVNIDHRSFPQGPMTAAKLAELHKQRRAG